MRGTMTRKWINRMKQLSLLLLCLLLAGCTAPQTPAAAATPDPSVKTDEIKTMEGRCYESRSSI